MPSGWRRILYVITDLEVGGVPLHVQRLATAMRARGHVVRVVSLAAEGPVSHMLRQAGIEVAACGARSTLSIPALLRLRRHIAAFKPDVVHALLFHANLACRLVCPLAGVPPRKLICEIQTVEIERLWHLALDRWTHALCRLEIGNSPSVVEHLHRAAGLPPAKLRVVAGGVDVEHMERCDAVSKAELGIAEHEHLLLWVGRLDPVKGLDDLLDALAAVNREEPVQLILLGDGSHRAHLEARIRSLGLRDRARLLGVRHDVPRFLKACDVFVFPSHTEGLPNALLEAMAAACPIVCTDVPGNRDLIRDGHNGLCVPPRNARALADGIVRLLRDREWAARLGAQAQDDAKRQHNAGDMILRYQNLYQEI